MSVNHSTICISCPKYKATKTTGECGRCFRSRVFRECKAAGHTVSWRSPTSVFESLLVSEPLPAMDIPLDLINLIGDFVCEDEQPYLDRISESIQDELKCIKFCRTNYMFRSKARREDFVSALGFDIDHIESIAFQTVPTEWVRDYRVHTY